MIKDFKYLDTRSFGYAQPLQQTLLTRVVHGLIELLMAIAIFIIPLYLYMLV